MLAIMLIYFCTWRNPLVTEPKELVANWSLKKKFNLEGCTCVFLVYVCIKAGTIRKCQNKSTTLHTSLVVNHHYYDHMTRTALHSLSLQNYWENPLMRAVCDGASRARKSRPALLGSCAVFVRCELKWLCKIKNDLSVKMSNVSEHFDGKLYYLKKKKKKQMIKKDSVVVIL